MKTIHLRPWLLAFALFPLCFLIASDRPETTNERLEDIPRRVDDNDQLLFDEATLERLARDDVVRFVEMCLRHQRRLGNTYSGTLFKQERVENTLQQPEEIDFWFREQPYCVRMEWRRGGGLARRVLFVDGSNNNKLVVLPTVGKRIGLQFLVERDPEGADARRYSRYPIRETSLRASTERTLRIWSRARDSGTLRTQYLGIQEIPELDGRRCFVIHRFIQPPEDGEATVQLAFDCQFGMPTGSLLLDSNSETLGKYHFTKIVMNPKLPDQFFHRDSLRR
jgi:hypothetical protein